MADSEAYETLCRLNEVPNLRRVAADGPSLPPAPATAPPLLTDHLPLVVACIADRSDEEVRRLAVQAVRRGLLRTGPSAAHPVVRFHGADSDDDNTAVNPDVAAAVAAFPDAISRLCQALGDANTAVAEAASKVLQALVRVEPSAAASPSPRDAVLDGVLALVAASTAPSDPAAAPVISKEWHDTLTVRLVGVVVRLAATSSAVFDAVARRGLVETFGALVGGDDLLLQMNLLGFFPRLAATHSGAKYLASSTLLTRLLALCGITGGGAAPEGPDPLLGTPAVMALGDMFAAAMRPSHRDAVLQQHLSEAVVPGVVAVATTALASGGEQLEAAMCHTLACVAGHSAAGLRATAAASALHRAWFTHTLSPAHSNRAAAVHALGIVIEDTAARLNATLPDAPTAPTPTATATTGGVGTGSAAVSTASAGAGTGAGTAATLSGGPAPHGDETLCMQLLSALGSVTGKQPVALLLDFVSQGVDADTSHGALRVLRGLAALPSGVGLRQLFTTPGFMEMLFGSPPSQGSKDGRLWFLSLQSAVRTSPGTRILSEELLERVTKLPLFGEKDAPK